MTLSVPTSATTHEDRPVRPRIAWVELNCLTCGEVAGYVEDQRIVRPVNPDGIRIERGRLRCGRCGGLLLTGARGVANTRDGIG